MPSIRRWWSALLLELFPPRYAFSPWYLSLWMAKCIYNWWYFKLVLPACSQSWYCSLFVLIFNNVFLCHKFIKIIHKKPAKKKEANRGWQETRHWYCLLCLRGSIIDYKCFLFVCFPQIIAVLLCLPCSCNQWHTPEHTAGMYLPFYSISKLQLDYYDHNFCSSTASSGSSSSNLAGSCCSWWWCCNPHPCPYMQLLQQHCVHGKFPARGSLSVVGQ